MATWVDRETRLACERAAAAAGVSLSRWVAAAVSRALSCAPPPFEGRRLARRVSTADRFACDRRDDLLAHRYVGAHPGHAKTKLRSLLPLPDRRSYLALTRLLAGGQLRRCARGGVYQVVRVGVAVGCSPPAT